MSRYQIKIEYDGTQFVGWQYQKNGLSIQEVIQKAIFKFSREKVKIIGAGRTDAGVHAIAQVAHFELKKKFKKKSFIMGVNQYMCNFPISITNIIKVNKNFHARFSATLRVYKYVIVNRQSSLALDKNKAWHIRKKLNLKLMQKGAQMLVGTHDFSTFRSSSCSAKSPLRTINKVLIKNEKNKIVLTFVSKSFLQQQVRSMVGCIKYLGEKKWSLKYFKEVFKSKSRQRCAPPAPPNGLYLSRIFY